MMDFEGTKLRDTIAQHFLQVLTALVQKHFPSEQQGRILQLINYEGQFQSNICGHVFADGDVVYRCEKCGYDATCVMCVDCFQEDEHSGHSVKFSVSEGSGGCCDCGDAESWKTERHSPCRHEKNTSKEQISNSLQRKYPVVPEVFQPQQLPALRNDDFLRAAFTSAHEHARGWDNNETSKTMPDCSNFDAAFLNHFTGFIREVMDNVILAYQTKRLLFDADANDHILLIYNDETHSFNQVNECVERALHCGHSAANDIACSVDRHGRCPIYIGDPNDINAIENVLWSIELRTRAPQFKIYLQEETSFLLMHILINFSRIFEFRKIMNAYLFENGSNGTLLEEMMTHDHYLYKEYRVLSKKFFITCVMSDPFFYKPKFAQIFSNNYSYFYKYVYPIDDEPEHSMVLFSVQLFTSPGIAKRLIFEQGILSVMLEEMESTFEKAIDKKTGRVKPEHKSLKGKRFYQLLHDFSLLLAHEEIQQEFQKIQCNVQSLSDDSDQTLTNSASDICSLMAKLLKFLAIFEGMDPNVRKKDVHVEYESNSWIPAFNLSLQLASIIKPLSKCLNASWLPLIASIVKVVPDSFHTPLCWLAGGIIETFDFDAVDPSAFDSFFCLHLPCWRKLEFIAEVQSNLWVRNGYSIRNQVANYLSSRTFNEMYANDLKLLAFFSQLLDTIPYVVDIFNFHFESAAHLEEILFLVLRLVTYTDPKMITDCKLLLIHTLAQGPQSFEELKEILPDDCVDNSFETVLTEVSVKTGVKYELKKELYPQIDICHPFLFDKEKRTNVVTYLQQKGFNVWNNKFASNNTFDFDLLESQILECPIEYIQANENILRALFSRLDDEHFTELKAKMPMKQCDIQSKIDKKQKAKEFQEKIKKDMIHAQQQFSEKNECVETASSPDCCVICQTALQSECFGYFGKRELADLHQNYHLGAGPSFIYSTCGHPVHRECFLTYEQGTERSALLEIMETSLLRCPICQKIGNTFIPETEFPPTLASDGFELQDMLIISSEPRIKQAPSERDKLVYEFKLSPADRDDDDDENKDLSEEDLKFTGAIKAFEAFFYQHEMLQRIDTSTPYYQFSSQLFDMRIFNYLFKALCINANRTYDDLEQILYHSSHNLFNVLCETMSYLQGIPTERGFDSLTKLILFNALNNSKNFKTAEGFMTYSFPFLVLAELLKCCLYPEYKSSQKSWKSLIIDCAASTGLVELPKRIDLLVIQMAGSSNCSTPLSQQAICMICYCIVCPNLACCSFNGRGACYEHLKECGFDTGIFMIPGKGIVQVLHVSNQSGTLAAPYTNATGELHEKTAIASEIRRGSLLVLDEEAYKQLNEKWLKFELINCISP